MLRRLLTVLYLCQLSLIPTQAGERDLTFHWNFDAPLGSVEKGQTEQGYSATLKRGHGHHPVPSRHPGKGRLGGAAKIESRSIVEATVPHPLGESWTLSFWLNQERVSRVGRGMMLPDISLGFPDHRPGQLHLRVKDLQPLTAPRITPGKWEHYCLVVQPGRAATYLNGYLAAEQKPERWVYPHASGKLHFGATNWHRMLIGLVDEVRLYEGALTEDAIRQLALEAYHPKAEWIAELDDRMKTLIHAGLLARHEADGFRQLGAPSAEALLQVLKTDAAPARRGDAAWALGALKAPGAFKELTRALPEAVPAVQVRICQGLCALGDPAAADALSGALLSEDSAVRAAAAQALAAVGEPGVAALASALSASRWEIRLASATALRKGGWKASDDTTGLLFSIAIDDWRRVEKAGKLAAPALAAVLVMEDDSALLKDRHRRGEVSRRRSQALKLLEKLGPDSVAALVATLTQPNPELQKTAAGILETIADPRAVPALIRLLKSTDPQVVAAGAAALAPMRDAKATAELLRLLAHPNSAVRRNAVAALGAIGEPAIESLAEGLSSEDPLIREAAAEALGQTGEKKAMPALAKALRDRQWRVRARAAEALGNVRDPAAAASIAKALKDADWTVRVLAAKALGRLRTDAALAALKSASQDQHRLVRDQVRRALSEASAEPVANSSGAR